MCGRLESTRRDGGKVGEEHQVKVTKLKDLFKKV